MSDLLLSLLTKEQPWTNHSCFSFKKNYRVIHSIDSKNSYLLYVFDSFSLLFPFLCLSFSQSLFFKERQERLALVDLTKEQPCAHRSRRSLQKSDREPFAQVAHDKRVTGAIRSFACKKNERFARKTDEQIPNPVCCLSNYKWPPWSLLMMSRCGGCGLHVPKDEVLAAQTLALPGNYSTLYKLS